ncbi:MAG: Asp-tRNA(Asn)/Glu-tRNA(Gln) amidotransferase subunit GatC [Deltaproteobacteria bacterium]|nr:Asp-tRNA(Asn)/Glu-tRNA(Gln) amidotransferase subunit GatC [Deltaproteobacteria bacterium]
MSITKQDVLHVAELARLALSEEEMELYTRQLQRILNYVEKLSELDTRGVVPTTYTVPLAHAMREDVTAPSIPQEEALQNAPEKDRGCFKVPQVIE